MAIASLYCLAYVDPGAGTLLAQFILAAGLGSLMVLRNHLIGMASWIRKKAFAPKN
jgi:hypothetical protein